MLLSLIAKNLFKGFTILALYTVISCSQSPSISEDKAFNIAQEKIVQDSVMALDFKTRTKEIFDEDKNWHVTFPLKSDLNLRGGEPHVIINKKTGEIVNTYYTR